MASSFCFARGIVFPFLMLYNKPNQKTQRGICMERDVAFAVKTRGGVNPQGKPRVFFTCHPQDFDKYFTKITEDILKSQDCAIYYTEDQTVALTGENNLVDLGRMNLFVLPVTFKMLSTANRAMEQDFRFALEHHIPVLPFMMEGGIDEMYSREDKFGELQYLNPFSGDLSEISYEEKLNKYLEAVLVSGELAARVRAAFDAYVFLSYRKKDRKYANTLMKLIHAIPECRDIAIWYDEFLMQGESFKENIEKILQNSSLFTLLVTPSLLETGNFVMTQEYPDAVRSQKAIFPAMMEKTDRKQLESLYKDIPACVDVADTEKFDDLFVEMIKRVAVLGNDNDPEHNFLIGLAYLNGIDVEVNTQRALELITSAAEARLPEAMRKLCEMYESALGVERDYAKALHWRKIIADHYAQTLGEEDPETLGAWYSLCIAYEEMGAYKDNLELVQKLYPLLCKVKGESDRKTLQTLRNMAKAYAKLDDYENALTYAQKACRETSQALGEKDSLTLLTLSTLSEIYSKLGQYDKALETDEKVYTLMQETCNEKMRAIQLNQLACAHVLAGSGKGIAYLEKAYEAMCDAFGEEHPYTLIVYANLASRYTAEGDNERAQKILEDVCASLYKAYGEEHPDLLAIQSHLATTYENQGRYDEALEILQKRYDISCRTLGKTHSSTIESLNDLAGYHTKTKNWEKAIELYELAYELRRKVLGEEHPSTAVTLGNLGVAYSDAGRLEEALEIQKKALAICEKQLGPENTDALIDLNNVATIYQDMNDNDNALKCYQTLWERQRRALGENHPKVLATLKNIVSLYEKEALDGKALEANEALYACSCQVLGEDHLDTLKALSQTARMNIDFKKYDRATQLYEKLYAQCVALRGEEHQDSYISLAWLSYLYGEQKIYEKSLPVKEKLYAQKCRRQGPEHPDTLTTLDGIAIAQYFLGQYSRSLETFEKLYPLRVKVLGPEDPITVNTFNNLEHVRRIITAHTS